MPDTQFDAITLNADGSLTATGPYNPQLVNDATHQWEMLGDAVVVFLVVGDDAAGNPDVVANGVGEWKEPAVGQPLKDWSGTVKPENVPGDLQVGTKVRAVGAAIQIKTNKMDAKNPPVIEVVTWCVPHLIDAPQAAAPQ